MNKKHLIGLAIVISLSQIGMAVAGDIDPAKVPGPKQTEAKRYLSSKEADVMKESMGNKALLIDVRTQAEVKYVGVATLVDANIPYMTDDYSAWDDKNARFVMSPNSGFVSKMADLTAKTNMDKTSTIILMCRSGDRSARAADLLGKAGYTNVYSVVDGFEGDIAKEGDHKGQRAVNGWKNAGLPWTYDLTKSKMYVE